MAFRLRNPALTGQNKAKKMFLQQGSDPLAMALAMRQQQQQAQPTTQSTTTTRGSSANFGAGKGAAGRRSPVARMTSESGEHATAGLGGYPAHDYFARPGSAAVAPVSGQVVRLSGHDPKLGAVQGAGGPLGWSVYIRGNDGHTYFLTHMGSRTVKPGQRVRAGQKIGTVANYDKYGRPSHIHMGVH